MKKHNATIIMTLFGLISAGMLAALIVTNTWFSGILSVNISEIVSDENNPMSAVIFVTIVLLSAVVPYLLGSLNFAIMVSREYFKDDVRKYGSGNAGVTNMKRVYGGKAALLTFFGDTLKTSVSVLTFRFLGGEFCAYLAGLFVVLGHIAPIWYKFKGGKGVLASAIAILILDPLYFAIVFAVFAVVYLLCHYVSMASVSAAFIYPAVVYYGVRLRSGNAEVTVDPTAMIFAVAIGLLVIFKHRENIRRVYNGEEKKTYFFKKTKPTE